MSNVQLQSAAADVFLVTPARSSPSHKNGTVGSFRPILVRQGRIFLGRAVQSQAVAGPEAPDPRVIAAPGPGVEGSIVSDYAPPRPVAPKPQRSPRLSVMMEGNLVQRVEPHYPEIAKQLNIQGPVVIKAVITREGLIEHQILESGQSLLAKAALDAVRQWHYRPYVLNGEPIAVETEITVNFILQQ